MRRSQTGSASFISPVTHEFAYRVAKSASEAATLLSEAGTAPLGGGTDLLVAIEDEIERPRTLVDLREIAGWRGITPAPDGGARIGAATRIAEIADSAEIRSRFPALAEACAVVAIPTLRAMGTLGGNLCQRPRCWYLRSAIPCLKNGGSSCPAVDGENQYLAILDGGPCHIVHPSDPAVALTALDATVEITARDGARTIPISAFYTLPRDRMDHETILTPGEIVSAVNIPASSAGGVQHYHKLMQREAWDFAIASIACCKRADGDVRMVLGGVAPRPWRVPLSIEEDVASGGLDADIVATLAERALYDAKPLSKNSYKIALAASLLRQAMTELA